jgi:hypothetical protein
LLIIIAAAPWLGHIFESIKFGENELTFRKQVTEALQRQEGSLASVLDTLLSKDDVKLLEDIRQEIPHMYEYSAATKIPYREYRSIPSTGDHPAWPSAS